VATTGSLISLDDVYRARERIGDRLHRTPLLRSGTLSEQVGADVRFKAELFQRTGSFKPRGVLNRVATLTPDERERGVTLHDHPPVPFPAGEALEAQGVVGAGDTIAGEAHQRQHRQAEASRDDVAQRRPAEAGKGCHRQ